MATPKTTFGGGFALSEETTYGTEVTPRTTFLRATRIDIQRQKDHVRVPQFAGSALNASAGSDGVETVRETVGGTVVLPLSYNSLGKLWKHALGGVSTTGAGPYVHTYVHARSLPTGLSGEVFRGNAADEELFGLKVSKLTAEIAAGDIGTLTADLIGYTGSTRASAVTPSYATVYRVIGAHVGTLSYNSVTYTLSKLRVIIDNKLSRVEECGSLLTSEPERGDVPDFIMEVELYKRTDTLYTEHLAKTIGDAVIAATDANGYSLAFTLHNAIVHTCTDPMEGNGMQKTRATLRGYWDNGTDYGLKVVATNAESSGVL